MAAAPEYKIYFRGKYRGALKYLDDCVRFVAMLGTDAEIRLGHTKRHILWREGYEEQLARESYDIAERVAGERIYK